jgi:hypothetical protein
MSEPNSSFRTADLALAAALITLGYPLLGIHRNGSTRSTFEFANSEQVKTAALAFLNRLAKVEARGFAETLRTLKVQTR